MPKKPQKIQYKDIILFKTKDGYSKGNPQVQVRFENGGAVLVKRRASASTTEELERILHEDVYPEMYYKAAHLLHEYADTDTTYLRIGIVWEAFKDVIADNSNWSTLDTRQKKEAHLMNVLPYLFHKPMKDLTFQDYRNAVDKALEFPENQFRNAELEYYILLHKLTSMAAIRGICNDDPLEDYVEQIKTSNNPIQTIRDRFKISHLSDAVQRRIYERICAELKNEGLYFGIALMLFAGLSADECCALQKSDFKQSEVFPDIYEIFVQKDSKATVDNNGERTISDEGLMKSVYAYRIIPVHPKLKELFNEKIRISEERLSESVQTRDIYLFTKQTNAGSRVDPKVLKKLWYKLMGEFDIAKGLTLRNSSGAPINSNAFVAASILKNNMCYQLDKCGMTADEISYLAGRRMSSTGANHYLDWANDLVQQTLYQKLCRWNFDAPNANTFAETAAAIIPQGETEYLKEEMPGRSVCTRVVVMDAGGGEAPCKVTVRISSSGGFSGVCSVDNDNKEAAMDGACESKSYDASETTSLSAADDGVQDQ